MTDRAGGQYFCFFQYHSVMITMGVSHGDGLVLYGNLPSSYLFRCSIGVPFCAGRKCGQGRALARLISKTNL